MTDIQAKNVDDMWKKWSYYQYDNLDLKGIKISSDLSKIDQGKAGSLLELEISKELERN